MEVSSSRKIQCCEGNSNYRDIKYTAHQLFTPINSDFDPCMELEMDRRNALQWQVLYRLGYCLSGLGMLGSAITYNQAIANAQMEVPVRREANRSGSRHAPLSLVSQGNVAPPESLVKLEAEPQSASLEVPAATVVSPAVVGVDPAATTTVTPLEASHRATDLLPTAAIVPKPTSAAPQSASPTTTVAVPETVVPAVQPPCPTAITPGKPFDPPCGNATEAAPAPTAPLGKGSSRNCQVCSTTDYAADEWVVKGVEPSAISGSQGVN